MQWSSYIAPRIRTPPVSDGRMDPVPRGGFADALNLFNDSPDTSEEKVGYLIFFIWAYTFFCLYLYMRQQTVFNEWENRMPDRAKKYFTAEFFEKARQYELDKDNFDIYSKFYKTLVLTYLLVSGKFYDMWVLTETLVHFNTSSDGESSDPADIYPWRSVSFAFLLILTYYLVKIPLHIYYTFGLEEKYGFNQQSFAFFAKDLLKRFFWVQLILCSIAYWIKDPEEIEDSKKKVDQDQQTSFSIVSGIISVVVGYLTIEFMYLFVDRVVLRVFLNYSELPQGSLRERCEALANSVFFPPSKITVIDTSRWSTHANGLFFGFIFNKRIFLLDMLQKNKKPMTDDEMIGILAHELGHWALYHNVKKLLADNIYGTVVFWLFAFFWARSYSDNEIVMVVKLLPFIMRLVGSGGFFINYLANKFEFDADRYAVLQCGKGVELRAALIKLYQQNLTFIMWDEFYAAWYHTHPNVMDRLEEIELMLEELEKKAK